MDPDLLALSVVLQRAKHWRQVLEGMPRKERRRYVIIHHHKNTRRN